MTSIASCSPHLRKTIPKELYDNACRRDCWIRIDELLVVFSRHEIAELELGGVQFSRSPWGRTVKNKKYRGDININVKGCCFTDRLKRHDRYTECSARP